MANLFKGPAGVLGRAAAFVAGGAYLASFATYTVPPGHRAIIFDRVDGIREDIPVKEEGIHFLVPIKQKPIILETRTTPSSLSAVTGTRDLQKVNLSLRVLAKPKKENLAKLYKQLGADYYERILPSVANEVLKSVVAQYNADQLLTLRDKVSSEVRESLVRRCASFNIDVEDVAITHLNFSRDFSRAIEEKQVAEQNAERAKFVVAKAEQERQALIIRSEGDAEAAQLVSAALSSAGSGFIELRRFETAQKVAETLANGKSKVTYLPKQNNVLLGLK